jgi:hypothetical protein
VSRDGRDDTRSAPDGRQTDRPVEANRSGRRPDLPTDRVSLPRTDRREAVGFRDRAFQLRGSESRILATVGAFRVVPAADLADGRSTPDAFKEDLRRLEDQHLIERRTRRER